MLSGNHVLITDENAVVKDIVNEAEAGDDIEQVTGILSPGLINTHCHLELSHLKGKIPQQTGLVDFVQHVMKNRVASDVQKQESIKSAVKEMYENGIVAVGDICNTTDTIQEKTHSPIYWHNFVEVSGFIDATANTRFSAAQEVAQGFINSSILPATITPHAPYSVSKSLFEIINETEESSLISIHNQETASEDEFFLHGTGKMRELYKTMGLDISSFNATQKSSFQTWLPYFNRKQSIVSVHNSFFTDNDWQFAQEYSAQNQLYFCICINANIYIENTLPPIEMLMKKGAIIVIGTDSLASNHSLNLMDELNSIRSHFPEIELSELLKFCTINGAKALGISNKFGSFEKGKQPGLVRIWEKADSKVLCAERFELTK